MNLLFEAGVCYSRVPVSGFRQFYYKTVTPTGTRLDSNRVVYCSSAETFIKLLTHWNNQDWIYYPVST